MPRPKRTKRSSDLPASSSSARSSPKHSGSPDIIPVNDGDTVRNPSDASTVETVEPIDPAVLDEEDSPGDTDATSPTSTGKASQDGKGEQGYAHGSGGGFNSLKSFRGQVYSGMAVGGSHTWNYDPGVWRETKEEPDLWKVDYKTTKRRARNAPKGSGAPVGTEYHWFIVAHQHVKKMDANTYETSLTGSKYKLAHKGASAKSWSVPTVKGQREREVDILEDSKRRIQGLPPVHAGEKAKVESKEKGQQKLDALFGKSVDMATGEKRKRDQ